MGVQAARNSAATRAEVAALSSQRRLDENGQEIGRSARQGRARPHKPTLKTALGVMSLTANQDIRLIQTILLHPMVLQKSATLSPLFCVQMGRRRHEIVGAIHTQVAAGEQIKKQLQSELTRAHRLAIQEALGTPPLL